MAPPIPVGLSDGARWPIALFLAIGEVIEPHAGSMLFVDFRVRI